MVIKNNFFKRFFDQNDFDKKITEICLQLLKKYFCCLLVYIKNKYIWGIDKVLS